MLLARTIESRERRAAALAADLRRRVDGEVRFDDGSRALYATDASNYRQVPIGVVVPRDVDDVVADRRASAASTARRSSPRGGGTSLAGQCCNVAVVLDMLEVPATASSSSTPSAQRARVEPASCSTTCATRPSAHGLTFGPDPATHDRCTLGGMIGNNSCGVHSVMAGQDRRQRRGAGGPHLRRRCGCGSAPTTDEELARDRRARAAGAARSTRGCARCATATPTSIRARFPDIPRRVSGYNLDELLPENGFHVARALVGHARAPASPCSRRRSRLVHSPPARALLVLGYPDVFAAADDVPARPRAPADRRWRASTTCSSRAMRRKGLHPRRTCALLPAGRRLAARRVRRRSRARRPTRERAARCAARSEQPAPPAMRSSTIRRSSAASGRCASPALGATAARPGRGRRPGRAGRTRRCRPSGSAPTCATCARCSTSYGYSGAFYGHFGQGCVHTRIDFDLDDRATGIASYRAFVERRRTWSSRYGGSLSGEHGDGQARGELLPQDVRRRSWSQAFREFKAIWDPDGQMNPGKVVDPYPLDANLRLGADYSPPQPTTHFRFPSDDGSFARAALRCVGVGKCRRHERRHDVPELRSRARRSTRPAGARGCSSRCCDGDAITRRLARRGR